MSASGAFPAWFSALVPRLPTVARCHLPGAPLDARRRELVSTVVAEAAGNDALARLHAGWLDLLGPVELTEGDDELLAWASAAARGGPTVDGGGLPDDLSPSARRAATALVVHGVVAAVTAERAASLGDRVAGRSPRNARGALADLAVVAMGGPVTAPTTLIGAALGALGRLAPPTPAIDLDDDPNLLAQLLAETLPTWFGSAWGRTLVARLPVEIPVAVQSGLTGATVRVGRGRVSVRNGVADDVWALFDGEVDALLRAGTHSLARELRAARPRR